MALTNFAALTDEQKTYWIREVWSYMRNEAFVSKLMGTSENNAVQHITKLTKTEKGTRALMFLVAELQERGVANDNKREGMEEALQNFDIDINMGLISHQVRNKGKLTDQQHVIKFRETARDRLKYWLSQAVDQMAFLTLSGISYRYNLDGSDAGVNNPWTELSFADDVTPPSAGRHFYYDGTDIQAGDTSAITTSAKPKYGAAVDIRAYAKSSHMRPLYKNGKEYYLWVMHPRTLAELKKDPDFLRAVTNAAERGTNKNPFFTGAIFTVDGLVIMEHNLVFNTKGAPNGSKWGSAGDIDGTRSLILGSQALGFVDVGPPDWVEKGFEYDSQQGISVDKFLGFRKPRFNNQYTGNDNEDFGVIAFDFAL